MLPVGAGSDPSARRSSAGRRRPRRSWPASTTPPATRRWPRTPTARPSDHSTSRPRSPRSARRRIPRRPRPAARRARSAAGSTRRPRRPRPARCRIICTGPASKVISRIGAQPRACSRSSSPQDCSRAAPRCHRKCVDMVSLGNDARSARATRCPARASSMASGAPAHRAPTTITSYIAPGAEDPVTANRPAGRRRAPSRRRCSADCRRCPSHRSSPPRRPPR